MHGLHFLFRTIINIIVIFNFFPGNLQEVTFQVDYTMPLIGREFGQVFLGDKNVALLVVSEGWAKVLLFLHS